MREQKGSGMKDEEVVNFINGCKSLCFLSSRDAIEVDPDAFQIIPPTSSTPTCCDKASLGRPGSS